MKPTQSIQQNFAQIPKAEIPRSVFNRSYGLKTTFDAGGLIPVCVFEALPGDTINLRMHTFARMSTPLHPVMDNMTLDSFFFAVPYRLLWVHWPEFNGWQLDPGDSTDFTIPVVPVGTGLVEQSLGDYFGIPTKVPDIDDNTENPNGGINALPFRAYNAIWNQHFRDENLQDHATVNQTDGPDNMLWYAIRARGKRHDYFTSCLPWPQKGDAVSLPLGTTAPVIPNIAVIPSMVNSGNGLEEKIFQAVNTNPDIQWGTTPTSSDSQVWEKTGMVTDLSTATAATINQLRQAFQIQKLYERDARGGTRLQEVIYAHFGVLGADARLQRPEYLGGGTQRINVTAVPQTSTRAGADPDEQQGNLAAFGTSTGSNHSFTKSFDEHCIVMGLVSVRADITYQEGLDRMWSRSTRWDHYWPALAHIGEQAVLNKEIYCQGSDDGPADAGAWGYNERYGEYRYSPSRVTGLFRSNATATLDPWHLALYFDATPPTLNDTFIQDNPPLDRVVAVPTEPHFLFDAFFDIKHARPMPTYGVPGLIDHF